MLAHVANRSQRRPASTLGLAAVSLLAALLTACAPPPPPRTVFDFREDGHAREGVLARCNRDRQATSADVECANARRAAAIMVVDAERARAPDLERQSEEKLIALRTDLAVRSAAEQGAEVAALAAAEAAYEARWVDPNELRAPDETVNAPAPAFGAPLGTVLPSISESAVFVYPESVETPARPVFEMSTADPPANELFIAEPGFEAPDLAAVPRPFRDATAE